MAIHRGECLTHFLDLGPQVFDGQGSQCRLLMFEPIKTRLDPVDLLLMLAEPTNDDLEGGLRRGRQLTQPGFLGLQAIAL